MTERLSCNIQLTILKGIVQNIWFIYSVLLPSLLFPKHYHFEGRPQTQEAASPYPPPRLHTSTWQTPSCFLSLHVCVLDISYKWNQVLCYFVTKGFTEGFESPFIIDGSMIF